MKTEYSIGAVIFNKNKFLILKYGIGHWGLVKGNVEEGENKKETILRELLEETGINEAEIIDNFEEKTDYYYTLKGEKIHKRVDYLLLRVNTKKVKLSYEHDDYKWLPFRDAINQVDFDNVKQVLRKAHDYIEKDDKI
jgi:8-oxo-dGTP pyrophosphatase MutT (NUDIX family)